MSNNDFNIDFEFEDESSLYEEDSLDGLDELEDFEYVDNPHAQVNNASDDLVEPENVADYTGGSPVDSSELMEEDENYSLSMDYNSGFVSGSGDFVVMEDSDMESAFELKLIDIDNIAVTKRVRQNANADDITRSIKSTGLLMPIVVAPLITDGMYVLLDGWRRLMGCARSGKRVVPAIVNNKVNTTEISILESMYNHSRKYAIKEIVDYIDYLEKEKGIMNPSMIEYLLQLNSGEYTKLKDILTDNDEDITEKLYAGIWDIDTAFRKLEQRRKKESLDEKENKKAAAVYDDEEASGIDQIAGSGDEANGEELSEEQINSLMLNAENLDEGLDDTSLGDMIKEDKNIEGFKPHKQKVGEREYIDPIIRKAVMTRDNSTCACCKRGGEQYVDILDYHHILPVHLSGADTVENGVMLCVACHRMVHLYATDDLHVDSALLEGNYDDLDEDKKKRYPNAEIFEDEKMRLKRIIKLGSVIRKGIAAKGLNRERYKEEHSNAGIGRRKPGVNAQQERS